MGYVKKTWVNKPNTTTPILANDLNHMEQGIYDATYENGLNVSNEVDEDYRVNVLHSKNLVENILETQTKNGVTFTKNNNGSITLSGTATTNFTMLINTINLKAGKTYTISGGSSISANVRLDMRTSLDGTIYENNWYLPNIATKTINSDITLYFTLRIASGTNTSGITIYPMINEGSTALPYEPYITPSIVVDNDEIYNKDDTKIKIYNTDYINTKFYKIGKMVFLTINTTTNTVGSDGSLIPIPNELSPSSLVRIRTRCYNGSSYVNGFVEANPTYNRVYIKDDYGNVGSTMQYIYAQLFWIVD